VTDNASQAALQALAEHHRVATGYHDWAARPVTVPDDVVSAVLTALGVDVSDPAAALARALAEAPLVAPTVVADEGAAELVPLAGAAEEARVLFEDGGSRELTVAGSSLHLPADLPTGCHQLVVSAAGAQTVATLVVAPPRLPEVPQAWGWAAQLYQLRSRDSWGVGDLADLRLLSSWSGAEGAGLILVNPMHAGPPVPPLDASPYSPSSRRFRSPQYLRPQETPEYLSAPSDVRARVDTLAAGMHAANVSERIDRDASWAAKEEALALLFVLPTTPDRTARLEAFVSDGAGALRGFATYNALAELHGVRFPDWPVELRDPLSEAVHEAAAGLQERLRWHSWLQLLCDEQLAAAQAAAHESGMTIGVIHDLAVGVTSYGADAWALQGVLAEGLSIGAPPDSFNQLGQYWSLPPWHPTELAKAGYAPFRELIRSVLRHAGGIRIDHVLGLFRLWCIPAGETADRGTYVSYDYRALLAVLLLEASRAGAVVVGEDLGTVAPHVVGELAGRGILGNDVLWFELGPEPGTGLQKPISPEDWRALSMASLTTHDLPTAAGFLRGEHVRVREELGLLTDPAQDRAQAEHERVVWLEALRRRGLLPPDDGHPVPEHEIVIALYTWLGLSPARLLAGSLSDAVGDVRQANLPGTIDEYPSWRLPVADGDGRPQLIEDIMAAPMSAQVARRLTRSDSVSSTDRSELQRDQ
jgi:4-alpha-glucanotransferase